MTMNRNDFHNAIIDNGIMEITTTYLRPDQKNKREGGIAGFNACRGKNNDELLALLKKVKDTGHRNRVLSNCTIGKLQQGFPLAAVSNDKYWFDRYFELQVEWVLNVMSAAMYAHEREPLTDFTMKGMLKAAAILRGVDGPCKETLSSIN